MLPNARQVFQAAAEREESILFRPERIHVVTKCSAGSASHEVLDHPNVRSGPAC